MPQRVGACASERTATEHSRGTARTLELFGTAEFKPSLLSADTVIVTCGLLNFENSTYSSRESQDWIDNHPWRNGRPSKVMPGLLTVGHKNYDKESHTRFRRSFEANYPELCKERKIIVIDCTVITNPEHDRWLRDHLGTHPQTWAQVLAHKNFETSHRGLAKLSTTRKNLVITVCKSGCHRSLASSNSITPVIKDRLYGGDPKDTCVKTTDLQKQHHFDEKCGMCSLCSPGQKANDANRISAFRLLEPIIPKGKVPRSRSGDPQPKWHPSNKRRAEDELAKARKEFSERTSTATEHAASSSQLDPAATTDDVALGPLTGLSISTPRWSSEDGLFLGDPDLEKIVALLLWMARDFQPKTHMDVIHHTALATLIKCADDSTGRALGLLHTASIDKLSDVIDIMMVHKDGSPKDANATLQFMRRCARVRADLLITASDNATERVELTESEVSLCYQRLGCDLITYDLFEHQMKDRRYRLRNKSEGDTQLSGFQRSFVDNMLRKFLGDKRVALVIWQHGLPSIVTKRQAHTYGLSSKFDKGMLQSSLDECLRWYVALANDIVSHQTQEGFDGQRSASSLDREERQRQQTRRQALQKAREAVRLGATLAEQRDGSKRSYDDMDEAEQKTLEDHDTGRTKKAKQGLTTPKMKPFRATFVATRR